MKAGQFLFVLCTLTASGTPAQDPPEITSHQAPATFNSRVNLVSVPVVVRDTRGQAIGNLRQEDFRLFDQGREQTITKFSLQAAGGLAAQAGAPKPDGALPERYIAYIFDDIHMNFEDLTRVRSAAARHLSEPIGPNSRAAIATTSGRVWLDFSSDQDQLRQALHQIVPGPTAVPPSSAAERRPGDPCPPNIDYYRADQVLNYQNPAEIQAAEAAAVACFGPDPNPPALGLAVSTQVLSAGNADTQNTFSSLANLIRRLSSMPGSRSIVLLSSGFFATREFQQTETAFLDAAIRANISLSSLHTRGLNTVHTAEAEAEGDAIRRLTNGTGGKFVEQDNGFQEALDQLASPPEFTYVLGFSPRNLKFDGSYHGLKITLVNAKGLELEARHGYWASNQAADAAGQAKVEIQEAMFSFEERRDIPVDVTTEFYKLNDTAAELTVAAHLDLKGLKFRPAADRNEETLTVVIGLFDQNGHYVSGFEKVIDLRLRHQTLEKLVSSGMDVKESFDVAPGRYVTRVVVRDSEGQSMAARNGTVDIR